MIDPKCFLEDTICCGRVLGPCATGASPLSGTRLLMASDRSRHQSSHYAHAALGGTVDVEVLLDQKESLKIPPGTQNGTVFRFKGKGMPKLDRSSRGDLNVMVEVIVPTKLNSKQKKLLKEFAEAGSQEAEPHSLFDKIKDALWGGH